MRLVWVAVTFLTMFASSFMGVEFIRARRQGGSGPRNQSADSLGFLSQYPSGYHLIAFVFVSSACGFCREERTMEAIGRLRDSLRVAGGTRFAQVSVVGIALDQTIGQGLEYLRSLGKPELVFDEISAGGGWLNEYVANFMWRAGIGKPAVPQVILVIRRIDTMAFPRFIDIQADSVAGVIDGRDAIIKWVNTGAHVTGR
jgi:thiol-disulfide isomerase/thioredoxin